MSLERKPARYHIAPTNSGLEVAVNKLVIPNATDVNQSRIDNIAKRIRPSNSFLPPSPDHEWGFGPILRQTESLNPDWVIYSCDFPKTVNEKGKLTDEIFATSASLGVLFDLLKTKEDITTKSPLEQQMTIRMFILAREEWRSTLSITAELHSPLVKWLRKNMSNSAKEAILEALAKGYNANNGKWKVDKDAFRVEWTSPKWIYLEVPGYGTYIDRNRFLDDEEIRPNDGYEVIGHNIDRPNQQLSLLTGLAQIEDLAVGGYYRNKP